MSLKVNNSLLRNVALCLGAALLLWLGWPPKPLTFLIFVGFVPLLFLEDQFIKHPRSSGKQFFGWVYLGLLGWNALTTYWVLYATVGGGLMALLANSVLMSIPFVGYHWTRKRLGWGFGLSQLTLVALWFSLELLHLNWQLAWPWLNLGNVFSQQPGWVQWYEYTGAFGGTLWVWVVNLLVFHLLKGTLAAEGPVNRSRVAVTASGLIIAVLLPILISYSINFNNKPAYKVEAVVVQPNIDPYSEKFNKATFAQQLNKFFELTKKESTANTDLIIWPETSIPGNFHEEKFNEANRIKKVKGFLKAFPKANLLSGVSTYTFYDEKATPTARKRGNSNGYYDMFNAAVLMDTGDYNQFYHKSKLVPGVEKMPYPRILGFLQNLAIEMGGTSGSLGRQAEATNFKVNDSFKVAPVICYESIFGDYVGDYVQNNADLITIVTNDAWWGDTDGYKQHFQYSVLRAIEMRRSIARSANTGISGFITPNGQTHQKTGYWVKGAASMTLPIHKEKTFYARNGDYLGYLGFGTALVLVLSILGHRIRLVLSRQS